jgi:acyl carrier protein
MNRADLESIIKTAIVDIAPDAEPESLEPDEDMRDELDLDSMDFLNIIVAVSKKAGVNIPESDYAQVLTMDTMCEYVEARLH